MLKCDFCKQYVPTASTGENNYCYDCMYPRVDRSNIFITALLLIGALMLGIALLYSPIEIGYDLGAFNG